MPLKVWESPAGPGGPHPIGSGPFRFAALQPAGHRPARAGIAGRVCEGDLFKAVEVAEQLRGKPVVVARPYRAHGGLVPPHLVGNLLPGRRVECVPPPHRADLAKAQQYLATVNSRRNCARHKDAVDAPAQIA